MSLLTPRSFAPPSAPLLELGVRCVAELERLTGLALPADRLDVFGTLQEAFSSEAHSLALLSSSAAFLDPHLADSAALLASGAALCHEAAHQWFGGLVGPDDWSQLWLAEGLSAFFGTRALQFNDTLRVSG